MVEIKKYRGRNIQIMNNRGSVIGQGIIWHLSVDKPSGDVRIKLSIPY